MAIRVSEIRAELRRRLGLVEASALPRLKKPRKHVKPRPFTPDQVRAKLELAEQILAAPPAHPWIRRVEPVGRLVEQFVLPLSMLKSANVLAQAALHAGRRTAKRGIVSWQLGELKQAAYTAMLVQTRNRRAVPLKGRPMVLCTRFSAVEPDHSVNSFKIAIDRLKVAHGLCLLVDDKPQYCDDWEWWEPAPMRGGFGLIRVYTGGKSQ